MMRVAKRQNPQKRQVSVGKSLPAPTGGWNAQSPISDMPITDALILDNWIPRPGMVELRRGFVSQVTGTPAAVESMMAFRGGSSDKLFAATNGKLYDVTTAGSLGAAVLTGQTNNRYNYTAFANATGNWLIACNGADAPIGYSSATSTWAALPAITNAALSSATLLFNVFSHKGRLYYLEANSLRVYNPAAGAVGGASTLLDLSSIFSKGGRLICGANWAGQYGLTADEFAVFVTDQGQVAIYQGIDPTSATAFSLVGVFDFGPPLGPKALIKYGGDLALLTTDGVIPLSQGLVLDRAQQDEVALTKKIVNAFTAAARAYGANYGWSGTLYPGATTSNDPTAAGGALAIINVPTATLSTAIQFVQNVITGAWCRFPTGINAFCWEVANSCVYFGSTGGVYQWDKGSSDNGVAIVADVKSAFTNFNDGSRQKQFTMIRPILNTTPLVLPALEVDVDYQESTPTAVATVVSQGNTTAMIRYDWTAAGGIGYVAAARMQVNLIGDTSTPTLGVGDIPPSLLAINVGGVDNLLLSTGLPFDVPCQLLGFDLIYQPGGQL